MSGNFEAPQLHGDLPLHPEGTGTRLLLEHDGFDPDDPYQALSRRIMGGGTSGGGWRGVGARIAAVLAQERW